MHKIANTAELQSELRKLISYAASEQPSRALIARELTALSVRVAGEGDDTKSLSGATEWLAKLSTAVKSAQSELKTKKEPGRAMQDVVAIATRVKDEDWWEHWYH